MRDGKEPGDWKSRFSRTAWFWILSELVYLCLVLLIGIGALAVLGSGFSADPKAPCISLLDLLHLERSLAQWLSVALAGMLGGVVFDLKWLYHAVAKGIWHVDRILWRIIVPANSALVSLFFAFMIVSGVVPLLDRESFNSVYFGLGFGFLFGYFSDNVIAALQRLAQKLFGTLEKRGSVDP